MTKPRKSVLLYGKLLGLSEVQLLNLRLMELASFNQFHGEKVVQDLLANLELWKGVLMDGRDYGKDIDLVKLRDLARHDINQQKGVWNVNTVYILARDKRSCAELEALVKTWDPDEVSWIEPERAGFLLGGGRDTLVLRVWWD